MEKEAAGVVSPAALAGVSVTFGSGGGGVRSVIPLTEAGGDGVLPLPDGVQRLLLKRSSRLGIVMQMACPCWTCAAWLSASFPFLLSSSASTRLPPPLHY